MTPRLPQGGPSALWTPQRWEWAQVDVEFTTAIPKPELIQSVHLVGFATPEADQVILCREAGSPWFLPGGTREPDESVQACIERELREEAGAVITEPVTWIGAHLGLGYLSRPYRPHLPHPRKAWLWGAAVVDLAHPPTNPSDAEQVSEVRAVPYDEALKLLADNAPWYPEIIQLARAAAEAKEGQR